MDRILVGLPSDDGIRPEGTGDFIVRISTMHLDPGEHSVMAASSFDGQRVRAKAAVVVREREVLDPAGPDDAATGFDVTAADDQSGALPESSEPEAGPEVGEEDPFERDRQLFAQRFGHLGHVPPGVREAQISHIRSLRSRRERLEAGRRATEEAAPDALDPSVPVPGAVNWTPVGPGPIVWGGGHSNSGRTLSVAIDPTDSATMYVGTAGGGLWKSTDRGLTWSPKSDYQRSLAIGTIAIDPDDRLHIVAGTGEYNNVYGGTYFGNGLLRSHDGGDTWTELGTTLFERDEVSRVLFDPTDNTGQRLFLSSSIGVYESTDDGANWVQLIPGNFSDLVAIRQPGPAGTVKLIAALYGSGLSTSTRTSGSWSTWTQISSPALPTTCDRIELAQQQTDATVVVAVFAYVSGLAGVARTTDGGTTWSAVTVRLNTQIGRWTSSTAGHAHVLTVPAADLTAAPAAHVYTSTSDGTPAHTHSLSVTAQQIATLAGGGSITATTNADATGHTHTVGFRITGQTGYDLHVAVHPTDANTMFLGEVNLWRTTGGGIFNYTPNIHSDHHAFTFDPATPTTCWDVGDGGVYVSADGGATWSPRNRDLGTLQYISVSQHPEWENVMLGGTQDNGTHRYEGVPAWRAVAGGDGGFTAIDPSKPTRMFHQYIYTTFYRSDDAGLTWNLKNAGITGGSFFYAPFELDPSNPSVCYFGGTELWRSDDSAETWSAVTAGVGDNITAVAVHPTDSTIVYIGTDSGHVYRLERTGPTWSPADVTRTDLTAAPLPFLWVSDLAVDSSGTVWVSLAAILWSEFGEFTNHHVYRRGAADTTWAVRSNGLAQANPVNTIVIDPENSSRLFCGCDVGVFRTEDAGLNWFPWDEGIPNVPVFDLALHRKRRLLRAATHGRSIWERPIDAVPPRMVDLYVRDNMLDSGRSQPSPSGVVDPFDPAGLRTLWWWQSTDILVDSPEPNYQTPSPVGDYVALTQLQHRTARRGRVNRIYVQVHNRGISTATNVQVRAFLADASAGLPALPADFWTSGRPFTGTPTATVWTPVGPTLTIPRLEPAESGVLEWDFTVPPSAATHSCILAVATCAEDPLNGAGEFDVGTLVTSRKHVALKNLQVEDALPGTTTPAGAFILQLNNPALERRPFNIFVHWAGLPAGSRLFAVFERGPGAGPRPGEGVRPIHHGEELFPDRFTDRQGRPHFFDFDHAYEMFPQEDRHNVVRAVHIPQRGSRAVALNVQLPPSAENGHGELHVLQRDVQGKVVGGTTYVVRAAPHGDGGHIGDYATE
ncbi:glycosyl hydrolase [Streptomyces sp. NPDC059875]|uniref:glycosyl hydrolase n=1 Tax=unclassified Streptomyces TaxID=2593676 RepID=UPI0036637C19